MSNVAMYICGASSHDHMCIVDASRIMHNCMHTCRSYEEAYYSSDDELPSASHVLTNEDEHEHRDVLANDTRLE